jgi:hypothetical protein
MLSAASAEANLQVRCPRYTERATHFSPKVYLVPYYFKNNLTMHPPQDDTQATPCWGAAGTAP